MVRIPHGLALLTFINKLTLIKMEAEIEQQMAARKESGSTLLKPRVHLETPANTPLVRGFVLALGDVIAVALSVITCWLIAVSIRSYLGLQIPPGMVAGVNVHIMLTVPTVLVLWFSHSWGHYTRMQPFWLESKSIVKLVLYAAAIALAANFLLKNHLSRIWFVSAYICFLVAIPTFRYATKWTLHRLGMLGTPIVLIGNPGKFAQLREAIEQDFTLGYRVASEVPIMKPSHVLYREHEQQLVDHCAEISKSNIAATVLVAPSSDEELKDYPELQSTIYQKFDNIIFAKEVHGTSQANAELLTLSKNEMIFLRLNSNLNRATLTFVKRAFDVIFSVIAIVVLSPVLLVLYALVSMDGGVALFPSHRVGKSGVLFNCLKFRTMRVDADAYLSRAVENDPSLKQEWSKNFKFESDPRITSVGRFLRKTSLDELPQLFNVLKGDMSLVGPRPILLDEVERYGDQLIDYQSIKPGITGMWQVNGRSDLTYQRRIELNKWYIRNWTLWLDLTILLKTIPAVMFGKSAR